MRHYKYSTFLFLIPMLFTGRSTAAVRDTVLVDEDFSYVDLNPYLMVHQSQQKDEKFLLDFGDSISQSSLDQSTWSPLLLTMGMHVLASGPTSSLRTYPRHNWVLPLDLKSQALESFFPHI